MSHLALPFFKNPPARPFWLFLFILSLWGCLQAQEFVQRHPKALGITHCEVLGQKGAGPRGEIPFSLLSGDSCSMSVPNPRSTSCSSELEFEELHQPELDEVRDPPAHLPVLSAQGGGDSQSWPLLPKSN